MAATSSNLRTRRSDIDSRRCRDSRNRLRRSSCGRRPRN
jgi:hypothetical protein